jgi:hypothetical protein
LWRNFHVEGVLLWIVPAIFILGWAAFRTWLDRRALQGEKIPTSESAGFLMGASFIVICFFVGVSYVYKLVFALWLLPWLWRGSHPKPFPRFTQVTTWLLYAVLWFEGLGAFAVNLLVVPFFPDAANGLVYAILTGEQLLTWMLVACLLRWIFADVVTRARSLFQGTRCGLALSA